MLDILNTPQRTARWGIFALVLMLVPVGGAAGQLADAPWPKFGRDLHNSGRTPFGGEGQSWQQQLGSLQTAPVIAGSGAVYVGAGPFDAVSLYALSPEDGSVRWSFATDGPVTEPPAVGSDETIYVSGLVDPPDFVAVFPPTLGLYAVNPDGTQRWFFATGFTFSQDRLSSVVQTAPAIASDGTIYVGLGDSGAERVDSLFAINPDGTRKWAVGLGTGTLSSPTIAPDGTVYIGAGGGTLYAFTPKGSEKWRLPMGQFAITSPAIGPDGTIYVGVDDDRLVAVRPDGTGQWTYPVQAFSMTAPAVGPNEAIYVGVGSEGVNAFHAVNPDSTRRWTFETTGPIFTAPAVGTRGTLYFGVYNRQNSELVALRPDGTERWRYGPVNRPRYPLALAADRTVYLGADSALVSALGPRLQVRPTSLEFGVVPPGRSITQSVTIENTGDAELQVSNVTVPEGGSGFSVVDAGGTEAVAPGQTLRILVEFAPKTAGRATGTLEVASNAGTEQVALSGERMAVEVKTDEAPVVDAGVDVTASFSSASFQPTTHRLFYRQTGKTGSESYQSVSFAEEDTALVATIPAEAVTARGVDYYARFSDEQEHTFTVPETAPISHPKRVRVRLRRRTSPVVPASRTYRMVSVPIALDDAGIKAVLEDDFGSRAASSWRLLRWDPEAEQYEEFPDLDESFVPGRAFWLITRGGGSFDVEKGRSVDASAPRSITLQPGWNQIGNPFAFPVAWQQVRRPEEVGRPRLHNGVQYEGPAVVLKPWEGYFVKNNGTEPATIHIPPVADSTGASRRSRAALVPEASYVMRLRAQAAERPRLRDTWNAVGFSRTATDGRDRIDYAEPPGMRGNHLRLSIMENEERLDGGFKPSGGSGQWWDLEVSLTLKSKPPSSPQRVTIALVTKRGRLPDGYRRYVFDREDGRPLPIEDNRFSVEIDRNRPVQHLRLVLGTPEFAAAHRQETSQEPMRFALQKNVPNPFDTRTTIRYRLAERCPVLLEVYNMLGRHVATLVDSEQKAGSYEVEWTADAFDSGVYFYRLQAGSFRASRKMILLR